MSEHICLCGSNSAGAEQGRADKLASELASLGKALGSEQSRRVNLSRERDALAAEVARLRNGILDAMAALDGGGAGVRRILDAALAPAPAEAPKCTCEPYFWGQGCPIHTPAAPKCAHPANKRTLRSYHGVDMPFCNACNEVFEPEPRCATCGAGHSLKEDGHCPVYTWRACPHSDCNGTGKARVCAACDGSGEVGGVWSGTCPDCGGTGKAGGR